MAQIFTFPSVDVLSSFRVGAVVTSEAGSRAKVANVGSDTEVILNFTIPRGRDGVSSSILIGMVTTAAPGSRAMVTNSGTDLNPILNFSIPQGVTGLPGQSAYQLWLDMGNSGTEQDFIDAMKASEARYIRAKTGELLSVSVVDGVLEWSIE